MEQTKNAEQHILGTTEPESWVPEGSQCYFFFFGV